MIDYGLVVSAADLNVQVRLNDVPVFTERAGRRVNDENFVNEFMAAGKNTLTLIVRPAGANREPPPGSSATAELLAVSRGSTLATGELLAQVDWQESAAPTPRTYPHSTSVEADVAATDHRGWRNAQPIALSEDTRRRVLKLLRELTDALIRRDLNTVVALLDVKVSERARAYAAASADKLAQLRRDHGELMGRPGWGVEAWADEDARMELVGQSRLVRVTNPEEKPLIRSVDLGGARLVIPTSVAYVNGRWTIMR